jgi:GAF domain-containing protein
MRRNPGRQDVADVGRSSVSAGRPGVGVPTRLSTSGGQCAGSNVQRRTAPSHVTEFIGQGPRSSGFSLSSAERDGVARTAGHRLKGHSVDHQDGSPESTGAERYAALTGFAELVAETALSFLDDTETGTASPLLEQIVAGAVLVVPGIAAAAVETIDRDGRLHAPVAEGDAVARSVMDAQNDTGEGPCLDALRDHKQVVVDDLDTDTRWPLFTARAADLGIRSMVCTPLEAAGRRLGVLSLMSRDAEFVADEDTPTMATVFAAHAAIAMTGARRVEDINAALTSRDIIGQAKGILMERFKITPDVAFAMLVRTSAVTNRKLRDVCDQLCLTGVLLPDPPRRGRRRPQA